MRPKLRYMHAETSILSETVRLTRKYGLALVSAAAIWFVLTAPVVNEDYFSEGQPSANRILFEYFFNLHFSMAIDALLRSWPALLIYVDILQERVETGVFVPRKSGLAIRYFGILWLSDVPYFIFTGALYWQYPADLPPFAYLALQFSALVATVLAFTLFGTILPAYVANSNQGLRQALSMGTRRFAWIAGRFLCLAIIVQAAYWIPEYSFGNLDALAVDGIVTDPIVLAVYLFSKMIIIWTVVPASIVLAHAFMSDQETGAEIFA